MESSPSGAEAAALEGHAPPTPLDRNGAASELMDVFGFSIRPPKNQQSSRNALVRMEGTSRTRLSRLPLPNLARRLWRGGGEEEG